MFSARSAHTFLGILAVMASLPVIRAGDDALPPRAVARIGTVRLRHGAYVCCVAYSPDGKRIASAGWDKTLRLWDAATGKAITSWPVPEGKAVLTVAFSPKRDLLVTSSWIGLTCIWDAASGKLRHKLGKVSDNQGHCAFSHDGKRLAVRAGRVLRLHEVDSGKQLFSLEGHTGDVQEIVFLPGDARLASCGDDGTVRIWDLKTRKQVRCLRTQGFAVNALAVSPDGKRLLSGQGDASLVEWDLDTGKEIRRRQLRGLVSDATLSELTYSPDGKRFVSSGNRILILWEAASWKQLHRLDTCDVDFGGIAFSPDGKRLAACAGNRVGISNVETRQEVKFDNEYFQPISSLAFSHDGKLLAFTEANRVHLWELSRGREVQHWRLPEHETPRVRFSRNEALLEIESHRSHSFWTLRKDAAGCRWNKRNEITEPDAHLYELSADLQTLVSWDSVKPEVRIYRTRTGEQTANFVRADRPASWIAIAADSRLLAAGYEDSVGIHALPSGTLICQCSSAKDLIHAMTFDAPGRGLLALDGKGWLHVWELATGRERLSLAVHPPDEGGNQAGFSVSPDGHCVVAWSCSSPPTLWSLVSGKQLLRLEGHQGAVNQACFAPDGRTLATAGDDTTILLWDVADVVQANRPAKRCLQTKEMERLWATLAKPDAAAAARAMTTLQAAGEQFVPFVRGRLQPIRPIEADRLARWLADLDNAEFERREQAMQELVNAGEQAESALRTVLHKPPSLEARRRVGEILSRLYPLKYTGEPLRMLRTIDVLERLSSAEAVDELNKMARGAPGARLTREAQASLARLKARRASPR